MPTDVMQRAAQVCEVKVVRHVRTPAGERRYKEPIGSIIVGHGSDGGGHRLEHLHGLPNEHDGFTTVRGTNGVKYHVGQWEGDTNWYAVADGNDEKVIAKGKTQEEALKKLDAVVSKSSQPTEARGKTPAEAAKRVERQVDGSGRGRAATRSQGTPDPKYPNLTPATSEYEGYSKFIGKSGNAYYVHKNGRHWEAVDENDNVVARVRTANSDSKYAVDELARKLNNIEGGSNPSTDTGKHTNVVTKKPVELRPGMLIQVRHGNSNYFTGEQSTYKNGEWVRVGMVVNQRGANRAGMANFSAGQYAILDPHGKIIMRASPGLRINTDDDVKPDNNYRPKQTHHGFEPAPAVSGPSREQRMEGVRKLARNTPAAKPEPQMGVHHANGDVIQMDITDSQGGRTVGQIVVPGKPYIPVLGEQGRWEARINEGEPGSVTITARNPKELIGKVSTHLGLNGTATIEDEREPDRYNRAGRLSARINVGKPSAPTAKPTAPAKATGHMSQSEYTSRRTALLPYTQTGPDYNRRVRDSLVRADIHANKGEMSDAEASLVEAEVAAGLRPESDYQKRYERLGPPKPKAPHAKGNAEDRVHSAYKDLVAESGGWVRLDRLRAHLSDIPRAELDRALRNLYETDPTVSLEPEPNQKTLTREAREAAIRIGGEDLHLLTIRPRPAPRTSIAPSKIPPVTPALRARAEQSPSMRSMLVRYAKALQLIYSTSVKHAEVAVPEARDTGSGHTGAMVALVPTAEDAKRLSVEGGEPVDELHLTMSFLGKADDFSQEQRDKLNKAMATWLQDKPHVVGKAFHVASFNPHGEEPCIVVGLGGDDLHYAKQHIDGILKDTGIDPSADQHKPWIPHVTLEYTPNASKVADYTKKADGSPVTFDRVRVAFGGTVTDHPLQEPLHVRTWNPDPPKPEVADDVGVKARRVRTQDGERRYGQAMGDVMRRMPRPRRSPHKPRTYRAPSMRAAVSRALGAAGYKNVDFLVQDENAPRRYSEEVQQTRRATDSGSGNAHWDPNKHPRGAGGKFGSGGGGGGGGGKGKTSKKNPPRKPGDPLKKGNKGPDVKLLQQLLNQKTGSKLQEDGDFGPLTEGAVKAAQKKYGLQPTGIADKALIAAMTGKPAPAPAKAPRQRRPVQKKVRHVRTPAGERQYHEPIGSPIVAHPDAPSGPHGHHGAPSTQADTRVRTTGASAHVGMKKATPEDRANFKKVIGKPIPPAWTDVYIAEDLENAKVLVRGKDAKGRGQTMYSAAHTENQAAIKFERNKALMEHLEKMDSAIERDAMDDDSAAALLLIRRLGMRPGSDRDTGADKQAHGATNLLAKHVKVTPGGQVNFDFTGKKGVHIQLKTKDPLIADVIRKRLETRSRNDPLFNTDENKTRAYMRSTGVPPTFLLKDLRTMHANVVALRTIKEFKDSGYEKPTTKTEFRKWRREVAVAVSNELGNTPTLALSSYINPTVFSVWEPQDDWL